MLISVTDLSEYLYCQRKLYMKRVLKIFEPANKYLVLGSIRHNAHDFMSRAEESLVKSITSDISYDDLIGLFNKEHLEILKSSISQKKKELEAFSISEQEVLENVWPVMSKENLLRTRQIHFCLKTTQKYGEELWSCLVPKIMSEVRLESEKLHLKGIIDRLEVYENSYVPYELKTGSAPKEGFWPSHRIQLAAYMLLVEEKLGKAKEGFVHYLDTDQARQLVMNPFLQYEIESLTKKVFLLLEQPEPPGFCSARAKCANCGLKKECYPQLQG